MRFLTQKREKWTTEENELIKNIEKNKNSQRGGLEQHEHGYCHHHSGEHRHHHSSHRHHRRLFRRIRKIFREISKSRKWQTSFACIAICICVVACLVMKHESSKRNIEIERIQAEYQEQQAKSREVNAVIQEYMPGIVCWGDSLTYGGYPEELSKMLDSIGGHSRKQ